MLAVAKVADRLPGSLLLRVSHPLDEVVGHFVELASLQDLLYFPLLITLHCYININQLTITCNLYFKGLNYYNKSSRVDPVFEFSRFDF